MLKIVDHEEGRAVFARAARGISAGRGLEGPTIAGSNAVRLRA